MFIILAVPRSTLARQNMFIKSNYSIRIRIGIGIEFEIEIEFCLLQDLFNCAMSRKEGIYRRKKRIMAFDPYTPNMHAALEAKKREVYSALGRYKY